MKTQLKKNKLMKTNTDHLNNLIKAFLFIISTAIIFSCNQNDIKTETKNTADTFYTCTMDPQVHEAHPGDCPICGMPMVPAIDSASDKNFYTCSMDPQVHEDHPGDCPICGMPMIPAINSAADIPFYTCSMDPQVHEDHAGDCPVCGMPMIPGIDNSKNNESILISDSLVPVDKQKIISSLTTIHPEQKTIQQYVIAEGVIVYDTREEKNISSRYSGRIEKLYVKYMYQPIKKGDLLFEIYSPEIVTAQQEYIFLLINDASNVTMIAAAENKLLLSGMLKEQIAAVAKTKQPLYKLPVYSPYQGHIHQTMSSGQMSITGNDEISLKEGMYVTKGQTIFNLLDPHEVLASIKIAEIDASKIKLHQKVQLTIEGNSEEHQGEINFIEPFFQTNSKTISARVYLMNEKHDLKVGMFVNATVTAGNVSGLWIPKSAMLDLGNEKIVWLKKDRTFEAHVIKPGIHSGDFIQVIEGLNDSDEIASNAQYIADSESLVKR